ncbi:hypothetical protein COOONC_04410 [Cooperia oncophora]
MCFREISLSCITQLLLLLSSARDVGRALLIPVLGFIFVSAIIYDIIEDGTDDVPFVDAIFSIFLQFSAIGEMDSEFHGIIPYVITIVGVAMMSAVFSQMQHELERSVHGPEFTFSKSVYFLIEGK